MPHEDECAAHAGTPLVPRVHCTQTRDAAGHRPVRISHEYRHVCRHESLLHTSTHVDVCADTCVNMCVVVWVDVWIGLCVQTHPPLQIESGRTIACLGA